MSGEIVLQLFNPYVEAKIMSPKAVLSGVLIFPNTSVTWDFFIREKKQLVEGADEGLEIFIEKFPAFFECEERYREGVAWRRMEGTT